MKQLFSALLLLSILSISSCKNGSSTIFGGSWSYKGISYNAITAIGSTTAKTLTASTASTSEIDNVVFHFQSYPPAAGTYTVTNVPITSANQVYIIMNIGTKTYTLSNTASAVATVTVSGTKVSVSVPAVEFSNTILSSPVDAGTFTASVNQNL